MLLNVSTYPKMPRKRGRFDVFWLPLRIGDIFERDISNVPKARALKNGSKESVFETLVILRRLTYEERKK